MKREARDRKQSNRNTDCLNGLISKLNIANNLWTLGYNNGNFKNWKAKRKKDWKNKMSKNGGTIIKGMYVIAVPCKAIMNTNFPKLMSGTKA